MSYYFAYCLDGGLLYEGFNLKIMFDCMKNLDPDDNEELRFVISRLLYFRKEGKDSPPDSVAGAVMMLIESTNMLEGSADINMLDADLMRLQSFCFCIRVMKNLILHDWLLHHLNDPYLYTRFFSEILSPYNHWSAPCLRIAVLERIIVLTKDNSSGNVEMAMLGRSDALQLAIVPPIIRIFRIGSKGEFLLACEALIELSKLDTYRMYMMREGLTKALIKRLNQVSDPLILERCIMLINEITFSKDAS